MAAAAAAKIPLLDANRANKPSHTTSLNVRIVTYNIHSQNPPTNLHHLLGIQDDGNPDIIVVGLQELNYWPSQMINDYINNDPWTCAITLELCAVGYIRVKAARMLGVHLTVYVLRKYIHAISQVEAKQIPLGFGGYMGNKGSVAIRMDLFQVTICFVNSHFTHDDENAILRVQEFLKSCTTVKFDNWETDSILSHDFIFWLGDLNSRLDPLQRSKIDEAITSKDYASLLRYDQLKIKQSEGKCFEGFTEGAINFPPTYKYDVGTDRFDSSTRLRRPAWCDRVLCLIQDNAFQDFKLEAKVKRYASIMDYRISDHKPVFSEWRLTIPRGFPNILVTFETIQNWTNSTDISFELSVSPDLPRSTWDWVALYRGTFRHFSDYETFIYVENWSGDKGMFTGDSSRLYQLTIQKKYLSTCVGTHVLGYYSKVKDTIVGFSNWFKISVTEDEANSNNEHYDLLIR